MCKVKRSEVLNSKSEKGKNYKQKPDLPGQKQS